MDTLSSIGAMAVEQKQLMADLLQTGWIPGNNDGLDNLPENRENGEAVPPSFYLCLQESLSEMTAQDKGHPQTLNKHSAKITARDTVPDGDLSEDVIQSPEVEQPNQGFFLDSHHCDPNDLEPTAENVSSLVQESLPETIFFGLLFGYEDFTTGNPVLMSSNSAEGRESEGIFRGMSSDAGSAEILLDTVSTERRIVENSERNSRGSLENTETERRIPFAAGIHDFRTAVLTERAISEFDASAQSQGGNPTPTLAGEALSAFSGEEKTLTKETNSGSKEKTDIVSGPAAETREGRSTSRGKESASASIVLEDLQDATQPQRPSFSSKIPSEPPQEGHWAMKTGKAAILKDHRTFAGSDFTGKVESEPRTFQKSSFSLQGFPLPESAPVDTGKGDKVGIMLAGNPVKQKLVVMSSQNGTIIPAVEGEEYGTETLMNHSLTPFKTPVQAENQFKDLPSPDLRTCQVKGKIQNMKDESPSGSREKGFSENSLDFKGTGSETVPERLLNLKSGESRNPGDVQGISQQEDFQVFFANRSPEHLEGHRSFSVEGKMAMEKTGDFKGYDPQLLMKSLVDGGSHLISKGGGRVKMILNPPNLGSLDMDIRVRNNRVDVVFVVDTPEIQQTLQANTDFLRVALDQQGLKIDGCNVLLQGGMDSNSGHTMGESALWRNPRKGRGKEKSGNDETMGSDGTTILKMEKRPDPFSSYQISLFI